MADLAAHFVFGGEDPVQEESEHDADSCSTNRSSALSMSESMRRVNARAGGEGLFRLLGWREGGMERECSLFLA